MPHATTPAQQKALDAQPFAARNTLAAEGTVPRFSVIVPAYRAAETLRDCVQSILDGAPAELELFLVEDGSPDETGTLCDALAAQDHRIRALHRQNGGASAARNTGLRAATGDWVMFVDADDHLLPGLWQALRRHPKIYNRPTADESAAQRPGLVLFGLQRASGPCPNPLTPGLYPRGAADFPDLLDDLLFSTSHLAAPYHKLFSGALLRQNGLLFDEHLAINEDIVFNLRFLQICSPIYCLEGVYYYQNDLAVGSLSRQLRDDLLSSEVIVRAELSHLLNRIGLEPSRTSILLQLCRVHAYLCQYGLLTGFRGRLSLARRRALFAEIVRYAPARQALLARLRTDRHPLLAMPYRIGVAGRLPGWLAFYTWLKSPFLR